MPNNGMIGPLRAFGYLKKICLRLDNGDDVRGKLQFADEVGVGLEEVDHDDRGEDYPSMFIPYTAIAYIVEDQED